MAKSILGKASPTKDRNKKVIKKTYKMKWGRVTEKNKVNIFQEKNKKL